MTELKKKPSIQNRVQTEIDLLSEKKRKDMTSEERVRLLQLKIYLKAKQEKSYKFYVLYDKIFQKHILTEAYRRSRTKNGSSGIDKQTFAKIEIYGREKFYGNLGIVTK